EVRAAAQDREGAGAALETALDRYTRKEHLVGAAKVRGLLAGAAG
ncbi:MAG: hypothetical protein H0V19_06375, partial [Euzebyales bacterium]|nr:hypothetical protein [Euzebyales bacterium]